MFNLFVVTAFLGSLVDHWFVGHRRVIIPLRTFLLGCFIYTESYLAVTSEPAMWLYVSLNVWGLISIYAGTKR